jgi:predicted Rossmann-fold nucleotide-binding protein
MKILVVGSLRNVQSHAEICTPFVTRLGELIVERGHTLLTGCRGSLDRVIAEAAHRRLEALNKDSLSQLVAYRLQDAEPVHRLGTIRISKRKDWELTHPELVPPEQIAHADAAIFVAGGKGTFIAANWARIAGIPVLGMVMFGGAGQALYEFENRHFEEKYGSSITLEEFEVLTQDTTDIEQLAGDVLTLTERIVMPRSVFPVMPFSAPYRDVTASYTQVCQEFGFELRGTEDSESMERIIPRILQGIRRAAFVIADVSEDRPNVFYEIGFAQGLGKQVILTAKTGTVLPFDVADIPVIFWESQEDLKEQLRKRLPSVARRLRSSGSGRRPR